MTEVIQKAIESSPIWHKLNAEIKAVYEQHKHVPNHEEYQSVRTMIICRVIMDDENVRKQVSDDVWEQLQAK